MTFSVVRDLLIKYAVSVDVWAFVHFGEHGQDNNWSMIIISPWIVNFRYLAYLEVCSAFGKVFFSMHLFILSVNGEVMYVYSETSLIELAGIRSGRVAISSDPFFIICCSIYLKATLRSTKESLSLDPNILFELCW